MNYAIPAVLAAFALAPASSFAQSGAQTNSWHWIRVEPLLSPEGKPWEILQGTADVIFSGQKFHVVLKQESKTELKEYSIDGFIRGGDVSADEVQMYTDSVLRHYVGHIEKHAYKNAWGHDRIFILSDGVYIGISRTIAPTGQ